MRKAKKLFWMPSASAAKSIAIYASLMLYPLPYYPGQGSSLERTGLAHPILRMIGIHGPGATCAGRGAGRSADR
jgi:hypothetical protein